MKLVDYILWIYLFTYLFIYFKRGLRDLPKSRKTMVKSPKNGDMKVKLVNKDMNQIWNSLAVNMVAWNIKVQSH